MPSTPISDLSLDDYFSSIKQSSSSYTLASTLCYGPGQHTHTSDLSRQATEDGLHAQLPQDVIEALHIKQLSANGQGVVHWLPNSSSHPRQWSAARKTYDLSIICILEFFTTLISNTGSSVARYASEDLGISDDLAIFCFVTLYLFGQALGGLVFPPTAEAFGGRTIYVLGAGGFAASCLILGASPTVPAVVIGRFMSGVFSAMPTVVAVGSIVGCLRVPARSLTDGKKFRRTCSMPKVAFGLFKSGSWWPFSRSRWVPPLQHM